MLKELINKYKNAISTETNTYPNDEKIYDKYFANQTKIPLNDLIILIKNNMYGNKDAKEAYIKNLFSFPNISKNIEYILHKCYLEFIIEKIVKNANKIIEDSKDNETRKLINNLDLIKNKYHIDLSKLEVNHYIKNVETLNVFIDFGFKIDFKKDIKLKIDPNSSQLFYKKIIEYKIPEKICSDPKDFCNFFFNGEGFKYFFSIKNKSIINDPEYLKLYIDKYGLKLTNEIILNNLTAIKNKKAFKVIASTHPIQIKEVLTQILTKEKESIYSKFLTPLVIMLDYIKEHLNKNLVENFISYTIINSKNSSFNFLNSICSTFDKGYIKQIIQENNKFESELTYVHPNKKFEYFELLAEIGIVIKNITYFDNIVKSKNLGINLIKQFIIKIKEKNNENVNNSFYLGAQMGFMIEQSNKNPEKTCYCNNFLFKAVKQECIDEAIHKLKIKYPNFDINKCDDYGYTVADYFITNYITYKYGDDPYLNYESRNIFDDNIFLNNLISLSKNNYSFSKKTINLFKKLREKYDTINPDEYKCLISYMEKSYIINTLKIYNKTPKDKEDRVNILKKITIKKNI